MERTKKILRKGKQLIAAAFIAETNERNEYGRAVLERTHPFSSSSSDLLQAALECNADYQYQDRAVPDCNDDQQPTTQSNILYGCRIRTAAQATFMRAKKGWNEVSICV